MDEYLDLSTFPLFAFLGDILVQLEEVLIERLF